jgi:uncharacterized membrane protein
VAKAHLIAVRYSSGELAEQAAAELPALEREHALVVKDAAVALKHDDERIELRQTRELALGEGAVAGGAIGLLLGIPLGIPVAAALLGIAGGGGLSGLDRGISDQRMRETASALRPGEAVLFLLAADVDWSRVQPRLAPYGGETLASDEARAP